MSLNFNNIVDLFLRNYKPTKHNFLLGSGPDIF